MIKYDYIKFLKFLSTPTLINKKRKKEKFRLYNPVIGCIKVHFY